MDFDKKVVQLDINDILPNRFQPRIKFNEDSINELCESIREHGVIQPIVVRKMGDKFEIIAGERRFKASLLAGKSHIPAVITELNDKDSAEVALVENVQRRDLTPIEEAISYKKILDMGFMTQDDLAKKLGKTQSTVANKLRLLNLDEDVQEALLEEKISERHARSLLRLNNVEDQKNMLNKIINERLTVRKTDDFIAKMLKGEIRLSQSESVTNTQIEENYSSNNMFLPSENLIEKRMQENVNILNNYTPKPMGNIFEDENVEKKAETNPNNYVELSAEDINLGNNMGNNFNDTNNIEPTPVILEEQVNNSFVTPQINEQNNFINNINKVDEEEEIVPSFEDNVQNDFVVNIPLETKPKDEPVIIIDEEKNMNNEQYIPNNNYMNSNTQYSNPMMQSQGMNNDFNPFDLSNNSVSNNDFNIPSAPISESPQMNQSYNVPNYNSNNNFIPASAGNLGIEEPTINTPNYDNTVNPGFMDIDKIEKNAVDISNFGSVGFNEPNNNYGMMNNNDSVYNIDQELNNVEIFPTDVPILRPAGNEQTVKVIEEEEEMKPGKFFSLPLEDEEDKNVEAQLESNPFEFNVPNNMENMMSLNLEGQPVLKTLDDVSQFKEEPAPVNQFFNSSLMNDNSNQFNSMNNINNPVNQFGLPIQEQFAPNMAQQPNSMMQPQTNMYGPTMGYDFGQQQIMPTQTMIPPVEQANPNMASYMNQSMMMQHPMMMQQPQTKNINMAYDAIKECVQKIKALGFNVNTEDFDFENMYQIMFRIEK